MSEKPKEQDPFKPQEPNIPGVTGNPARYKPVAEPPRPVTSQFRSPTAVAEKIPAQKWLAIAAIAIGLASLALFLWKHSGAQTEPDQIPVAAPVVDLPPAAAPQPAVVLVVGPGPVATTAELAKPWSSKRFEFHDPQTADNLSAVVVHLPSGVPMHRNFRAGRKMAPDSIRKRTEHRCHPEARRERQEEEGGGHAAGTAGREVVRNRIHEDS